MSISAGWNPLGWSVGLDPTQGNRPDERNNKYSLLNWGYGVPQTSIFNYSIILPDMIPQNNIFCLPQYIPTNGGWLVQNTAFTPDPINGNQTMPVFGGPYAIPSARAGIGGAIDNSSPTEGFNQLNGVGALRTQFMYPTTVNLVFNQTQTDQEGFKATVFGYDWYGQNMQEMYDLSLITSDFYDGITAQGKKAFWGITGIFFNGNTPVADTQVVAETTTKLGLPWRLMHVSDVIQYGQGPSANLIGTVSYTVGYPGVSTATSPDTRGTFSLTNGYEPYDWACFTYVVQGASPWITTLGNYQVNNALTFPQYPQIKTPDDNDLYGFVPYFTGLVE